MTTPQLGLPELEASQSQPEIIVNKVMRMIEAAVQLTVIDKDLATPPGAAAATARYIVGTAATGAWFNKDTKVAFLLGSAWAFLTPQVGWKAWVQDEGTYYVFDGAAWVIYEAGSGAGSVTVIGQDGSPTLIVADVTTLYFANATVEDLGGGGVRVTGSASGGASEADLGMFFPGAPGANQLMFKFVANRSAQFPANFTGSRGHIGTNPTGTYTLTVASNGATIGTVAISTGGVFTFATTAGAIIAVDPGDVIVVTAPGSTDATAADIAASFLLQLL